MARRSGKDWYIGAMTDATERTLTLDLSFLGSDVFGAVIYQDGSTPTATGTISS